jgi:hypothetical protein
MSSPANAISASSLFRVAFPTSSPEAEDEEMRYISNIYDTVQAGREDDTQAKLTGTWYVLPDPGIRVFWS